jgi:peptidoglycan/xylan/chitin deacetylase (PgdA/CDA1 family)
MGAILCFHSLTTPELPADGDAHVPLRFFKRAVRVARHLGEIVPLDTLVGRCRTGASTSGLIALTFDDAYAALGGDFADFVSKEQVPITVFVTTDAAAHGRTFWWDRIDDSYSRVSPEAWEAFERDCGLPDAYRRQQPAEFGPLRPLRQWILARYAGRWPRELESALGRLETAAGSTTRHRAMTLDEIAALARIPNVDLGVHTVSHPVLPLLGDDELRREIVLCYSELRQSFACALPILAIPFALYDRRTIEIAREAGMTASLSLSGTVLCDGAEAAALPRICLTRQDSLPRLAFRMAGLRDALFTWKVRRLPAFPDLPSAAT